MCFYNPVELCLYGRWSCQLTHQRICRHVTCPKEAAATGSGEMYEKSDTIGCPVSASITAIASELENGGIWSCSFSSSLM